MKIKIKITKCVFLISMLFFAASCEEHLDEDFNNPEKTTVTKIDFHFTQALLKGNFRLRYIDAINFSFNTTNAYTDASARDGNDGVGEINVTGIGDGFWKSFYVDAMAPIAEISLLFNKLSEEEKENYKVYLELGKICKVLNAHQVTDMFGDIPYSEAFKGRTSGNDQILFPKYDTQEEVYDSMLSTLKEASDALKTTTLNTSAPHTALTEIDFIFQGDLDKWGKFANSLRLRLAIRISDVNPTKAETIINEIISSYPLIESNQDNVTFDAIGPDGLNGLGESFSLSNRAFQESFNNGNTYLSETMMNTMVPSNDPRLPVMFEPNLNGDFVGIPNAPDLLNGWLINNGVPVNSDNVSIINRTTFQNNELVPGVSFTAAETAFLKAEAIIKGFISGNAQEEYEKGIRLSIEFYFGIRNLNTANGLVPLPDETAIATFLNTAPVAYDGTLSQIWTQKWIHHNTFFPFESWAEYRRTNTPLLPDYFSGGIKIAKPVRFLYPASEDTFNPDNYKTVSDKDTFNTNVWWDVN